MGNLFFHRAHLLDILVDALDKDITRTHFSKRLVAYTLPKKDSEENINTSPIVLTFKDGTVAACDVLIGCDGIHSTIRQELLDLAASDAKKSGGEEGKTRARLIQSVRDPVWSGSVAYRGVIPREVLENINPKHKALQTGQNVSDCLQSFAFTLVLTLHFLNFSTWERIKCVN